jgi:hypothetical protein
VWPSEIQLAELSPGPNPTSTFPEVNPQDPWLGKSQRSQWGWAQKGEHPVAGTRWAPGCLLCLLAQLGPQGGPGVEEGVEPQVSSHLSSCQVPG